MAARSGAFNRVVGITGCARMRMTKRSGFMFRRILSERTSSLASRIGLITAVWMTFDGEGFSACKALCWWGETPSSPDLQWIEIRTRRSLAPPTNSAPTGSQRDYGPNLQSYRHRHGQARLASRYFLQGQSALRVDRHFQP